MRALRNTFLLLLAATGLASCGGGGGGSNTATNHVTETVTVTSDAGTIYTNSQANIIVTVKTSDGAPAPDGQGVTLTVTPGNLGTVSGGGNSGATATKSLSGGQATFEFNSSGQAGTVVLTASVSVQAVGDIQGTYTFTGATNVNIQVGNKQDPRLQLTATTQVLPLNPFIGEAEDGSKGFFTNSLGSPYISEVTVTWRHSNGQLVSGGKINDAVTPTTIATLSELDDPNTTWSGANSNPPKIDGNEFLTLVGSESVSVSAGVGTIFVHSGDVPGTALLSVTAVDPDDGETISSQMVFTVAGAAPNTNPSSVVASTDGTAYISGSNGPQSTVVTAEVFDGSNAFVADPNNSDNVTFQIVGPANSDARLTTTNA
ncbi:MAG TPA: hypothetical protein VFB32_14730, partial [Rudaea sp.]|nr:hypothetical protein [Rudaea sp.]